MRARSRSVRGGLTVLLLAAPLVACDSDQPTDTPPPSSSASSGSSSTVDPRAAPAVAAYEAYTRSSGNAARLPLPHGSQYPPAADFEKYSFDPARARYLAYVSALAESGVTFRGTPPSPRVKVISVEPDAKPYPVVTLTDCRTPAPDWRGYRDDKPLPVASAAVPPPYLITAKVIFYEDHWGVQSTSTDTSKTCTA
jgi:hypothetical protein